MAGPFLEYTAPDVYTRTLTDATVATLTGGIRIPLFIGVGDETLELTDQEIIRGSSAVADNFMSAEDVSSQLTGTNRELYVSKYPVVIGDGTGTVTENPTHVVVNINGEPSGVAQLFGEIGKIVLSVIPRSDDAVTVDYYFKRTDTQITDEDLSEQADGSNKDFKIFNVPIVDGSDGGVATTSPLKVTVKVNGTEVSVSEVDGQNGIITLASAPALSSTVLVTYWTNTWQDTFDYLPISDITEMVRVGTAPGRNDFTETLDYIIDGNKIQWGNSFSIASGTTAPISTAFGSSQLNTYLYDNKVYARPLSGLVDGSNKEYSLEYIPTEGNGKGTATDDVSLIKVYVGADVKSAVDAGEVTALQLSGLERKVTLKVAPTGGNNVYATYWHNMIADDTFTFTSTVPSTPSTDGEFTISSANNGDLVSIVEDRPSAGVFDPDFATEGVTYPAGGFDGQTIPGFTPEETIILNFVSDKDYLVISSIGPDGSNGSGSLDQTYIDDQTGVRFTVMRGTTVTYQSGDILEFDLSKTFKTKVIPYYDVPGLKITTNSTLDVSAGNVATLNTYNKSGLEPDVGDFYYVTAKYAKTDYPVDVYFKIKDVQDKIGEVNTDNRLSLAAFLAFQNGAVALALAQVLRDSSGIEGSVQSYLDVLSEVESPLPTTGVKPNIICPITTQADVINAIRLHCEKMSTIRYKSERTGVFGFEVGATPEQAQDFARLMKSKRMVALYPDGAVVGLVDELGNESEAVVDGSFLAAAYAGLSVNPIYDVATPLTNKSLVGFKRLARRMDSVTMNQTAVAGITVLEDLVPNFLIRHSMTTDPSNILTREPTVIYIQDYVQQQIRATLKQFIGIKFVSGVLSDIEVTVSNVMSNIQNLDIIGDFADVSATQDENDPTVANVEVFYSPVLPLNWIVATFNLRVRL